MDMLEAAKDVTNLTAEQRLNTAYAYIGAVRLGLKGLLAHQLTNQEMDNALIIAQAMLANLLD